VADRRAVQGRNADALDDLLGRCERALGESDADRATVALVEIDRRLPEAGGEATAERANRCRNDLAMLRELNAIDDFRSTIAGDKLPDSNTVADRWRAAFAGYGASPEARRVEAATLVTGSLVRNRLLAALDLWLVLAPDPGVRVLLQAADPDQYRDTVRDAVVAADRGRVIELHAVQGGHENRANLSDRTFGPRVGRAGFAPFARHSARIPCGRIPTPHRS
jgi:hypothetical protein